MSLYFDVFILLPMLIVSVESLSSPILVVVSFDGFWYKYLSMYDTPNLHSLIQNGTTTEFLRNVYITKTFPNHFSIATGLYEETHGIVANQMYDSVLNETFSTSNTDSKWWDNGFSLPIWVANQIADASRHSGGMMWPGSDVKIHGQTSFYKQAYNESIKFNDRVDMVLSWILDPVNPANCIFMYIEQPDAAGHDYGPYSAEVEKQVKIVDNVTGYLIEQLKKYRLYDNTNLIILSDHGMAEVPAQNNIMMDEIVDPDLYIQSGTTPVWSFLPKKGKEDEVYNKLLVASRNKPFRVWKVDDIPDEFHYKHNHRILSIVVEANEGWNLVHEPPENVTSEKTGNHGYNNSLDSMIPLFIAHGPDFKVSYVSKSFRNIDLYPLMCKLLGIPIHPSNGTLEAVENMLKSTQFTQFLTSPWLIVIFSVLSFGIFAAFTVLFVTYNNRRKRFREAKISVPVQYERMRATETGSPEEHQTLLDEKTDEL